MARSMEENFYSKLKRIQDNNNAIARENAEDANRFSWRSMMEAERFNAQEAEKNRAFQMDMSSSAHSREVRDLISAGLNPVLSANNGASVTSGSAGSVSGSSGTKADIDTQLAGIYAQYKMNKINNAQALKINGINNKLAKEMNEANIAASMYGANKSYLSALAGASATRYAAYTNLLNSREQRAWNEEHDLESYGTNLLTSMINTFLDGGSLVQKGKDLIDSAGHKVGELVDGVVKNAKGWLAEAIKNVKNKQSSNGKKG